MHHIRQTLIQNGLKSSCLFPEGMEWNTGMPRHAMFSGCDGEIEYLLMMRRNICHYAEVLDTYGPCVVRSTRWNNDSNMELYCTTTDRRAWSENIMTISDEAFILLCLVNYSKRWYHECIKESKLVSMMAVMSILYQQQMKRITNPLQMICFRWYVSCSQRAHGPKTTRKTCP